MRTSLALSILILSATAGKASACSCTRPGNILERCGKSDLILFGTLASSEDDTASGQRLLKFTVHRVRGDTSYIQPRWMTFETPLSGAACGFGMAAGKAAIVFGRRTGSKGGYRTSLCSGNIVEPSRNQLDSLWPRDRAGGSPPQSRAARKAALMSDIRKTEDGPHGQSVRDIYVHQLVNLAGGAEDPEIIEFFLELIEKDRNEWVRLEAAADMQFLKIPPGMRERVVGALEKCRKNERIDFQVLASHALIAVAKQSGSTDPGAVETLARIARGEGMADWKIMVPYHNLKSMVRDPATGKDIPYRDSRKTGMRLKAMDGLAMSGDRSSRIALRKLEEDGDIRIRERARQLNTVRR